MKHYIVKGQRNKFYVIEANQGLVIKRLDKKSDAEALAKKLNSGYAFAGFTPPFFALKEKVV